MKWIRVVTLIIMSALLALLFVRDVICGIACVVIVFGYGIYMGTEVEGMVCDMILEIIDEIENERREEEDEKGAP